MLKYPDKALPAQRLLLVTLVALLSILVVMPATSCGLFNLKPVIVRLTPSEAYTVLPSRNTTLMAEFSTQPVRLDAERAFCVNSRGDSIEGDYSWNGTVLSWSPIEPYEPGRVYVVSLEGIIPTTDGRETRQNIHVPFYSVRRDGQAILSAYNPSSGSSISAARCGDTILRLEFSEPMNGISVHDAFSLSPSADICFSWDADMKGASILCNEPLLPCRLYTWSLSTEARSVDGSPLVRAERACVVTDIDSVPPRVERVYPVLLSGSQWSEAASDMNGIDNGLSIAIEFSEDLDEHAPYSGIRIEPSLSGRVERCSPKKYVYTPTNGWPPGEPLTLVVPAGLPDRTGLAMVKDWTLLFTPIFPFLRVLSVESGSGHTAVPNGDACVLSTAVGHAPEGLFTLTVFFSAPFDSASMIDAVDRSSMSVFFPNGIQRPSLRSAIWYSEDSMTLSWEGLRQSDEHATNYYSLRLPGGRHGISSRGGMYLEDEFVLIIEALP